MPLRIRVNKTADLASTLPDAVARGLANAADVYQRRMMTALAGGYTTGAFVGTDDPPAWTTVDVREVPNGLAVGSDVPYTLYWEMGHFNIFTRRYERVEHWRMELTLGEPEMQAAFSTAVVATLRSELQ